MILLIDNYDSFSYNLVQVLGEIIKENNKINEEIKVVRNDAMTVEEIRKLNPSRIILSPGPGRPQDAGICEDVIRELAPTYKMLGVCLGHQAICEVYGATITYAKQLMHGKQSKIQINPSCDIFEGLEEKEIVGRYHSLAVDAMTMPECLSIVAKDDGGEVMAVKHKEYELYGLQFHPESVLTPNGKKMLENFLK